MRDEGEQAMGWTCAGCGETLEDAFDTCWNCGTDRAGNAPDPDAWGTLAAGTPVSTEEEEERTEPLLPLTTTLAFEDRTIVEYRGVVTGEAILGANVLSDAAAGVRDVVGGRSRSYERKFATARDRALADLSAAARRRDADAVVGVSLEHETIRGSMLMVVATGTAVSTALASERRG